MKVERDYTTEEMGWDFDSSSLYARLEKLKDLRCRRGKRYQLKVILTMIVLAKLAGADTVRGIADWLKHRAETICRQ